MAGTLPERFEATPAGVPKPMLRCCLSFQGGACVFFVLDPRNSNLWRVNQKTIRHEVARGRIVSLRKLVPEAAADVSQQIYIFVRRRQGAKAFAQEWWDNYTSE